MAQFPTNNYDSDHGGVDENNNPNTPEIANANKGKERTGNALYSDKHYLDGDGFLYGLGMASQRMIVKGRGNDIDTDHFAWTSASTAGKLVLRVDSLVGSGLVQANNGSRLAVNPGNGLYIDMINQNKLAVSLFKKQKTPQSTPYNASGLEFATGAEWGGAPAAGQLRIKLSESGSGTSYINTSGLVLKDPGDIGNLHVTEGLMVNYDNVTIGLNASNQLEVKTSAIVPNISGTNPIEVTTSGNTKTIGLKLLAGERQGDISGMKVVEAGTVDESGDTLLGGLAVNVQAPLSVRNIDIGESAIVLDGETFIQWFGAGGSGWGLDSTLSYYSSGGKSLIGFNRDVIGQGLNVVALGNQQYRIDVMPGDYTEIKTMGTSGNQYTAIDVDIPALFAQVTRDKSIYGIGITPNSDASHANNLYVDGSVLAGDGLQGTGYSDSDTTVTPKLKLKIASGAPLYIDTNKALNLRIGEGLIVTNTSTTPTLQFARGDGFKKSGESIDVAAYNGITVNSNGVSVKPKSNAGIAVDANGVSVKIKSTSGIGVNANGVYLKAASTSEIGGVKTGTPATISETNTVDIPLFLDSNNVGWVRTNIFTQKAPASGSAGEFPYSASYIDTNYSTKTEVTAEIASAVSDISGREYKIFPTLPAKGESQSWADFYAAYKKYIALVSNTGSEPDAYKEYILIVTNESTGECHWEQIGDTEFTTDNFVAKTDVLTQAEVASIVQDVFGF